jgi:hypothetical protein
MAQRHKGDRVRIDLRVPGEVMCLVAADVARTGLSSVNQYLADLLCHLYRQPSLALELGRQQLQLDLVPTHAHHEPADNSPARPASTTDIPPQRIRVPAQIAQLIDHERAKTGIISRNRLATARVCIAYSRADLAVELDQRTEWLMLFDLAS